ncbi:MAG: AAA family ATPase [Methanobacteriota archaeon]|nr:MAG: AAA family ATPase [Euryarchaeota archaeon]
MTRPAADSGAAPQSPTGPSGTRGGRHPHRDGAAAPGPGRRSRSPPGRASRDRNEADGPERSPSRGCGTRPRSLSSAGRTPGGPRRSRPIHGRLRCCTVCGPARCRCPPGGPARRRNRRTDPPRPRIGRSADGFSGGRRQRLFSAAVFASSVSFRAGPSVFKDQGKLSFDYLPDKMVHREAQTQRLFSLLRPIVEAGASSNAFLYGAVGTGKTHTAKRFCLDFRKYASESNRAVDWDVVNCRQRMGDDAVLLRLLQHFDPHFPERGFSIAEKMESLRKHLEKHKLHFIVILDEVDALLKKSGADLIYSFARIAEEGTTTRGNISMILISQRPNALEYMDAAALSTFRRTNVVEFPKYDRKELEDIVQARVALAMHPGTVDHDLIDLVADIASEFGDARYAIELLEKAGMLADEEREEEVAAEHVRGAKAHVHPIDVEERLGLLDVPKRLVLLSIARKSRKKAYITMGEAEEAYTLVCEEYGEKPRAHTQFWKYVKELDALGLVDTKLSGKGEVGKTTLISLPEIPAKVLADNLERSLKRR